MRFCAFYPSKMACRKAGKFAHNRAKMCEKRFYAIPPLVIPPFACHRATQLYKRYSRLPAPHPTPRPSHVRATSKPHPSRTRATSEPHLRRIRATSKSDPKTVAEVNAEKVSSKSCKHGQDNPFGQNHLIWRVPGSWKGALEVFAVWCGSGSAAYWTSLRIPVISSAHLTTPVRSQ